MTRYPCPCCRYLTLSEEPPGTYEICEVCRWEDDPTSRFVPIDLAAPIKLVLEH